jgi:hypothetical protein
MKTEDTQRNTDRQPKNDTRHEPGTRNNPGQADEGRHNPQDISKKPVPDTGSRPQHGDERPELDKREKAS